jgi:hypothetical protein
LNKQKKRHHPCQLREAIQHIRGSIKIGGVNYGVIHSTEKVGGVNCDVIHSTAKIGGANYDAVHPCGKGSFCNHSQFLFGNIRSNLS